MKFVIFNGSPRGESSNSTMIAESFLKGLKDKYSGDNSPAKNGWDGLKTQIIYLKDTKNLKEHKEAFVSAGVAILIFPLYTDAMPAQVKFFLENLRSVANMGGAPPTGFIVHSGFPEAIHSRSVEYYLEKLADRMGSRYLGTAVSGNSESIKHMPPDQRKKALRKFWQLGNSFSIETGFNEKSLKLLASRERFNKLLLLVFRAALKLNFSDLVWRKILLKNNAFVNRFDKPYGK